METPSDFSSSNSSFSTTPQFTLEKPKSTDQFIIEDLLDFSNEEDEASAVPPLDATTAGTYSTDSSNLTLVDSCNSSLSGFDPHFSGELGAFPDSGELCVPYDDLAELEWLSNFVEESFSSEDLQKLQLISGMSAKQTNTTPETTTAQKHPIFRPEVSVPGKARSKRSRMAPCNWSSRLLVLSPTTSSSESDVPSSASRKKPPKEKTYKKKEVAENSDGRKCLHCATDKTPQWRTGPMGPKTLCNACGVRYKSGRLVPEYRPASSPTFQLTKHSNSHRKVLELRRQKEMQMGQHQQFLYPNAMFEVAGGSGCDDYLIHHQTGPGSDYRQLI